MQTANCWVVIGPNNTDIPKTNVTPAELQYLVAQFQAKAGRVPVHDLVIGGDVKRGAAEEKQRLLSNYTAKEVEKLFGGVNPALPQRFDDAFTPEILGVMTGKPYVPPKAVVEPLKPVMPVKA